MQISCRFVISFTMSYIFVHLNYSKISLLESVQSLTNNNLKVIQVDLLKINLSGTKSKGRQVEHN